MPEDPRDEPSASPAAGGGAQDSVRSPLVLERDPEQPGLDLLPYVLNRRSARIGRMTRATASQPPTHDLLLPNGSVSREHAVVTWTDTGFVLQDTASRNGTFVNGFRIDQFPIKHGDRIRFGELCFVIRRYRSEDDVEFEAVDNSRTHILSVSRNGPDRLRISRPRLPETVSGVFGVINLHDYKGVLAGLSAIGIQRIEVGIARIVARWLDPETYAFRELDDTGLRIVLIARSDDRLAVIAPEIVRELDVVVEEVSQRTPVITWSTSSVDPEVAIRKAVSRQSAQARAVTRAVAPATTDELRWVHVSDLHFGAGTMSWKHDHEQVMSSLTRELEHDRFAAHRIFVTGDVAFSGAAAQYDAAYGALQRLAAAVDLSLSSVRVVPGNHDIDRRAAGTPLLAALHRHARSSPVALDEMLGDARTRAILLEKLVCFQEFIARLDGHPGELDWRERISIGPDVVDVWGLSSVWCSDHSDGASEQGGFSPNLVVGKSQYLARTRDAVPAPISLLLTHHPVEWLSSVHARWLRSAFAAVPHVHLCGHVHQHDGTTVVALGRQTHNFTIVAGACHSGPSEPALHSYSRCILRRDPANGWSLGWSPRVYDPDRDEFRCDRGRLDLDAAGYAWFSFPQRVPAPPPTPQTPRKAPPPIPKPARNPET